ncbi:MAG TPA: PAS domain-containing protein, partial [Stenomitos sp.]
MMIAFKSILKKATQPKAWLAWVMLLAGLLITVSATCLLSHSHYPTDYTAHGSVWLAITGGCAVSFLLFGLVLSLLTTRSRERQLADALTAELRESETFTRDIVNSLAATIAVLGPDGTIMEVNAPWRTFARENGASAEARDYVGVSYLGVCDAAAEEEPTAGEAGRGILAVLEGVLPEFKLEYPCHSPNEQRWFLMRVTPLSGGRHGAVVSHSVIT